MTTPETEDVISKMNAIWIPGWYELDQPLLLGERRKYWFYDVPPLDCVAVEEDVDLVFFNQLASAANFHVRYATIEEMSHPKLGRLQRVDTDGLDYIFVPVVGDEIVVNAEEEPGVAQTDEVQIDDWSVFVSLLDVSEPLTDVV